MDKHLNYTAMVEDLTGQRSRHTLRISGRDPQGAFDWCCGHRGLTRLSDLEEHMDKPLDHTTEPFQRVAKWSWRYLWQHITR